MEKGEEIIRIAKTALIVCQTHTNVNGKALCLCAVNLQNAMFFTASCARICTSTTSHVRVHQILQVNCPGNDIFIACCLATPHSIITFWLLMVFMFKVLAKHQVSQYLCPLMFQNCQIWFPLPWQQPVILVYI